MNTLLTTIESIGIGKEVLYLTSSAIALITALACIFLIVIFFSLIFRWMRTGINKDEKYDLFEMAALRKTAENVGINLSHEKRLQDVENGKTFRKRLEEKLVKDMFQEEQ